MKLTWDNIDERLFRSGIDHGALYILREDGYGPGVPWNGLTSVEDSSSGREVTSLYTNDIRSRLVKTKPERGGSIKCFTYPPEFEACIGGDEINSGLVLYDQEELPFGLVYRSRIGDVAEGLDHGQIIYIYYGLNLTSSSQNFTTLSSEASSPEELSFSFTSIPEPMEEHDPVSLLTFRSDRVFDLQWERLENTLYGTDESPPTLPYPDDLMRILEVVVVRGEVVWDDDDDADALRPDHLIVSLYKDVDGTAVLVDRTRAEASNNWTYEFSPQFRYDGDDEIIFSVSGVYGEELIAETNENLVSEGPVFKFVTEEYWPCRYDETIDGFMLIETRADDPLE